MSGIRILSDTQITDADEAAALNYGYQSTAIYSCSWGPSDDGKSVGAPSAIIEKAIVNGVQNGRGGKGSVFVFASGNGAAGQDQCNFDGYTNSIFTVTVAAIDHQNLHPIYSESCAANMISTYSSGSGRSIHTTDVGEARCTDYHSGTSAAAPLVSGAVALALQVRPELSWRDIQHLFVRTALQINPDDPDWERTAAGRPYSYRYGFGSLDTWALVSAARTWELVKPQSWLQLPVTKLANAFMDRNSTMHGGELIIPGGVMSSMSVSRDMLDAANVESLEHVTVRVWIRHTRRGALTVELISPSGIRSILATQRDNDLSGEGLPGWQFMTLKHW